MAQGLYTCILDYKHRNLTDETLPGFLTNQVQADLDAAPPGRVYVDLSFNRFTVVGLERVIFLMETHSQASTSLPMDAMMQCNQLVATHHESE